MELIVKITDADIGEKVYEINNPTTRKAVRAILLNDLGEIALLHKSEKNEYKLIGGGVENQETLEQALRREVLEESGCEITIQKELGYVEEYRTLNNFVQISYVYVAKVANDTKKLHLTMQEKEEGAELCWYKPEIALNQINNSYEKLIPSKYSNLYGSKIIIKRDSSILKYFIETTKNSLLIHIENDIYEYKSKLYELEKILPEKFIRISKSTILNLEKVLVYNPLMNGLMEAKLINNETTYISRKYLKEVRIRILGGR